MYDLLIRNAVLVTPDGECEKDLAIQNGKIAAFLERGTGEAEREIDASGRYAFPGIVDPHAHLNEPGWTWREDYEHGTKAAAVGGVTTVIDMPLNNAPSTTTAQRVKDKIELVEPSACVDFALWDRRTLTSLRRWIKRAVWHSKHSSLRRLLISSISAMVRPTKRCRSSSASAAGLASIARTILQFCTLKR